MTALARAARATSRRSVSSRTPYRRELQLHCYRMLGSLQDAEDLLQETLLAAWRGLDAYEERASVRGWLYRIATNRCLNALRDSRRAAARARRERHPSRATSTRSWLEPYPDVMLEGIADDAAGPEARYELRESVALAFVAGLQHLPPRQRAALVLRDVLGFSAAEAAAALDVSEATVTSALQRARGGLDARLAPVRRERAAPPHRRASASSRRRSPTRSSAATPAVVALLTDDSLLTMPPQPIAFAGPDAIGAFLVERACARGGRDVRLVPTRINMQRAFAIYLDDPYAPSCRAPTPCSR